MRYETALMESLLRTLNHKESKIYLVIQLSASENVILITAEKEIFVGTINPIIKQYISHIMQKVHENYMKLKTRQDVTDEPEGGHTPDTIANFILTKDSFLQAVRQKIDNVTVDQIRHT